jgi:hypothetical protein
MLQTLMMKQVLDLSSHQAMQQMMQSSLGSVDSLLDPAAQAK